MKGRLENKKILLGITGSIAAYKACELLRQLKKEGADVRVIMTESAQKFITPLTIETLSGHEVVKELFPENRVVKTRHVCLAEWADCILICPATANIIGKIAAGIADGFLSTIVMAARTPILIAPAMDYQMVQSPAYRMNCDRLKGWGIRIISPECGELASGAVGYGRLAGQVTIIDSVKRVVCASQLLQGKKVMVTAGPTHEPFDPVRFISNASSGKMGFALAEEAALRGADVLLISGPSQLKPFAGISLQQVSTAEEMARAVTENWPTTDIIVMAAAVSDFKPIKVHKQKIKKETASLSLKIEISPDILSQLKPKGKKLKIGFALETENEIANAKKKLKEKNLDLICLNNPKEEGSGFGGDTNRIIMIDNKGKEYKLPCLPKWETAIHIWDKIGQLSGMEGRNEKRE